MVLEARREEIAKQLRERTQAQRENDYDFNVAAAALIGDLRYPEAPDGTTVDVTYFAVILAYHLARCGWRLDPQKRQIKPRKITAQGVVAGAIEWVGVEEPDDPLADLPNMTMKEINALDPVQRAIAIRRIGGPELPDLPKAAGWHTKTKLNITEERDVADGVAWNGRKWQGERR
jgi:hypothetical protein